jgi:hypothetical protein
MQPLAHRILCLLIAGAGAQAIPAPAQANSQQYEPLADSVRAAMHQTVNDVAPGEIPLKDASEREHWLGEMSRRLSKRIPDPQARKELLTAIHYEATRAGLDPQLVLSLIQIESNFKKYALSKAGAHGYMQVMPFWVKLIGSEGDNLFHLRTNLRYGCTILRHYLDIEKGDLYRALGRYNGSLGRATYPTRVHNVWQADWPWDTAHKDAPSTAQVHATLQALQLAAQTTPPAQVASARPNSVVPAVAPAQVVARADTPPQATAQAADPVAAPAPVAVPPVVVPQVAVPATPPAPATPQAVATVTAPAAPQMLARADTRAPQTALPVGSAAPVIAQATLPPQPTFSRRNIVIVR